MLVGLKKILIKKSVKLSFLIVFLLACLIFSGGHFVSVKAFNDSIVVLPGNFVLEQSATSSLVWQKPENAFSQDLPSDAKLDDFNQVNSVYLVSGVSQTDFLLRPVKKSVEEASPELKSGDEVSSTTIEQAKPSDSTTTPLDNSNEFQKTEGAGSDSRQPIDGNGTGAVQDSSSEKTNQEIAPVIESDSSNSNNAENIVSPVENPAPAEPTPAAQGVEDGNTSFLINLNNGFKTIVSFFTGKNVLSKNSVLAEEVLENDSQEEIISSPEPVAIPLKQSLIFSDFSVPLVYQENEIGDLKLRLSLAALSEYDNDSITLEYSTGADWQELGSIDLENIQSNLENKDYFEFAFGSKISWEDVKHLKLRVSYQNPSYIQGKEQKLELMLDALWLEVDFNEPGEKLVEEAVSEPLPYELELVSKTKDFKSGEKPEFEFSFKKSRNFLEKIGAGLASLFYDEFSNLEITARLKDRKTGTVEDIDLGLQVHYKKNGKFTITFSKLPAYFKPGRYGIELSIRKDGLNNGESMNFSQDFTWGVLAFNVNKSIYLPTEKAYLQMAALTDEGHTLCDADLSLEITAPDGGVAYLNTQNSLIIKNPACGPDNVIETPDYYAYYDLAGTGVYSVKLTANTDNGIKEITDKFEVKDYVPFEIERKGPTRIYPKADYKMKFSVKANEDYQGTLSETMPSSFAIKEGSPLVTENGEQKEMQWLVNWQAGQTYNYEYTFDAPDISPEFFTLGPAQARDFSEARQWQIASDAVIDNVFSERMPYVATADATNYSNLVVATSTSFTAGNKYFIYISAGFSGSTATTRAQFQIRYGSSTQYSGLIEAPGAAANGAYQVSWMDVFDLPTIATSVGMYFRNSNGGTTYGLNAQIIAINLSNLDITEWQYSSNTVSTAHTTTLTSMASTTLDIADGLKDWLVFGMEEVDVNGAVSFKGALYDGATTSMRYIREGENAVELMPYTLFRTYNDVATGTEFSMQVADVSGATPATHLKSKIFALNLDVFETYKSNYSSTTATTTGASNVFKEIGNLNQGGNYTPLSVGDQLIFSSYIVKASSATASLDDRMVLGLRATTSPGWTWRQTGASVSKNSYQTTDYLYGNISTRAYFTIATSVRMEVLETTSATRTVSEVGMTIFSTKLKTRSAILSNEYQKKSDDTVVVNQGWTNENMIKLSTGASNFTGTTTDIDYYFELLPDSSTFTSSRSKPLSSCATTTVYSSCANNIWKVSSSSTPPGWYNTNWNYRKKITIFASTSIANQTGFPVLATTTDVQMAYTTFGGRVASSSGGDIIVTDSDGTSLLNFQREYYASSTGKIVLWIKTDISSTTNKELYVYYGNSSLVTGLATTTGVWDANYDAVWHLSETGSNAANWYKDSTRFANNGAGGGGSAVRVPTYSVNGLIDGLQAFDGAGANGDYIDAGTGPVIGARGAITVEAWFRHTAASGNGVILADGGGSNQNGFMVWWNGTGNHIEAVFNGSTSTDSRVTDDGRWHSLVLTWASTTQTRKLYIDGVREDLAIYAGTQILGGTYNMNIGRFAIAPSLNLWNGNLDEIRVSKIARDENWIRAQYNNQRKVTDFLSFGSEEQKATTSIGEALITGLPASNSGYKWQVIACQTTLCSLWNKFDLTTPNFYVDFTAPDAPGPLTQNAVTGHSVIFDYGYPAVDPENNFLEYKIFYKIGTSSVTIDDTEYNKTDDPSLGYRNYNGATTVTISGLEPDQSYVFTIVAYDVAGNKAAAQETVITTSLPGRARTVRFLGGAYTSVNGTTGQNSDTQQTFSEFTFSLAEKNVHIENAYVIFEAHYEAYSDLAGSWTGYDLSFDACQVPCTPAAFSGLTKSDTSVLSYDDSESVQARYIFDVTAEPQLRNYTGSGVDFKGQIGYNIKRGTAANAIARAQAQLVITYTSDSNSDSYTNTVIYPLQSSTASGTKSTMQADDCTLGTNCPVYSYKMDIPEYASSTAPERLSQWFQSFNESDANSVNDTYNQVRIGTNATSSSIIHESANGGTQGVPQVMFFPNVVGFTENVSQQLEYRAYAPAGAVGHYMLGGEVLDTYTASSAAPIKTRTVSFPLGVVNIGLTGAVSLGSVNVYFPENGDASGVVTVKKAWFRIISSNQTTGANTITVASKVGTRATTSATVYTYNPTTVIVKPTFNIIQLIPDAELSDLSNANALSPKQVVVSTQNSNTTSQGGMSAELMITYAYSDESVGYLSSLTLFAGQQITAPQAVNLATTTTVNMVFPESSSKKTLLGASLLSTFHMVDADGAVGANYVIDTNMATSNPSCSNVFNTENSNQTSFFEYYKSVAPNLATTNAIPYLVCFSNNQGADVADGGVKANAQLTYTYQYYNPKTISVSADQQYKHDNFTPIVNGAWTMESDVYLSSVAVDSSTSTSINFYYEVLDNGSSFTATATEPVSTCSVGTSFTACSQKIWKVNKPTTVSWYSTSWLYRKKITINASKVPASQTDFPVLATTTDIDLAYTASGGHMASSTGGDMVITDSDMMTPLNFERELYSSTTGQVVLWIKADISSTTNKDLYIYYGNPGATENKATTTGVWDAGYKAVWHMGETTGNRLDSTASGTTAVPVNFTGVEGVNGLIGRAVDLNAATKYLETSKTPANIGINGARAKSVSAWVNTRTYNDGGIFEMGTQANGEDYSLRTLAPTVNNWRTQFWGGADMDFSYTSQNQWVYFVTDYDGTTVNVYANGVNVSSRVNPLNTTNTKTFKIGDWNGAYFNGLIDEVRISNQSRSQNWITTEFNNQSGSSFLVFDSSETAYSDPSFEQRINISSFPESASGYKWQTIACNSYGDCSNWDRFNLPPNFKVDSVAPTAPGNLTLATTTATTIRLDFGATTTEANFLYYKIFYKSGLSGVDVTDTEQTDANLLYIDYNSATSTVIANLESYTQYVINIWAYDEAGNKTKANEIVVMTATAPHARSRTVQFVGGVYTDETGLTGQSSNVNQSFSSFDLRLAETGVQIRDAYVMFEGQVLAYSNTVDLTGYNLAFDSCQKPCTPNAWTGTSSVSVDDNNILAYSEAESNQVRLLFDVTNELQLRNYVGDNAYLSGQIGYRFETAATIASFLANAKATLVVTYAYDSDSSLSYTNTVFYPLDSRNGTDSGSRQAIQTNNCVTGVDCPLYDYNMAVPEMSSNESQWFQIYGVNDGNAANDVLTKVKIQRTGVSSNGYLHEATNGGSQGSFPTMIFKDTYDFKANQDEVLEIRAISSAAANYYILGGETALTYQASTSAAIKTRTVSYPLGVINQGLSTALSSTTVDVYFPENGEGSGIVTVKSAWLRIISSDVSNVDNTITVSDKVGSAATNTRAYLFNSTNTIVKPSLTIIHVIASTSYSELQDANIITPKQVKVYTTNSLAGLGGVSAELMITYTYSNESSGYLSSVKLYAGQSNSNANATSYSEAVGKSVFPEQRGTKVLKAGGLLASYMISDSDSNMNAGDYGLEVKISSGTPVCTVATSFSDTAGVNSFTEYYKNITSSLGVVDKQTYNTCFFIDNSLVDVDSGAKMNAEWQYTYQWTAPPTEFTQSDWRWYQSADSANPTVPLASENSTISNVAVGDNVRLRLSVGVSREDLAAGVQTFKLQYGLGNDCTAISSWTDVGPLGGSADWLGYNNPSPADGEALSGVLLASSSVVETYEETNPTAANPNQILINQYGEWDFALYNNYASSSNYCFRMVKGNGAVLTDYLLDSYPKLGTAPANTGPGIATNPKQYRGDTSAEILNTKWINTNSVLLKASANDPNLNETLTLYFELKVSTDTFTTATTAPSGACVYGTAYSSCASKIWYAANSVPGNFKTVPYTGTTSITVIATTTPNYKWQVLVCDKNGVCADEWTQYDAVTPNFRVDTTAPSIPGNLVLFSASSTSLILTLGATTTEANFDRYKIFYRAGATGVSEADTEQPDTNLLDLNYNGAATTTVTNLSAGTQYVFRIWAYDLAGNKASSALETLGTTNSSFNPPTGIFVDAVQRTDGSGAIDIVIQADDPDNDNTLRARVMYQAGTLCDYSTTTITNMNVSEADDDVTATYGDPKAYNSQTYQIGSTTGWILTAPGSNFVFFDWMSRVNIPNVEGTYCLGLVVRDGLYNQVATQTRLFIIDNINPTTPGSLSTSSKSFDSITLKFNGGSTDTHFNRYKIFYKKGINGVTENDTEHIDPNLLSQNFGTATTSKVSGLLPNTFYTFNIWAYDNVGNKASATEFIIKTNGPPANMSADSQLKSDYLTVVPNSTWTDENKIVLNASVHDQDVSDTLTFYYELLNNGGSFTTATTVPQTTCTSTVDWLNCSTKVWKIATTSSNMATDWYSRDWFYRKKITINASQVLANESGFTVLATTTDASLITHARSDGFDILFTKSDGTTTVPYEREYWNQATGKLVAWVKTDISSTTDTILYMYYGNSGLSEDSATTTGVWSSEYKGVWHLGETVVDEGVAAAVNRDSSSNANHGDQNGSNEINAAISVGQDYDGNDLTTVYDSASLRATSTLTLGAWVNVSAGANWKYKRTITLSTSTDQANFQVKVLLASTTFSYNKTTASGSDLRFYDAGGTALSYWVESWNTNATSTIWVKVANIGTTQLTMNYGNPNATAGSNFLNVMDSGGLRYYYYDGMAFDTFLGTGIDPTVQFNYAGGVTVTINGYAWENQTTTMSIRWDGFVAPVTVGSYTFYVTSDDGQRLYLPSSNRAINNWVDQGPTEQNTVQTLTATTSITYEWYQNGGGSAAQLEWTPPASGRAYIPSTNLYNRKYMATEPVATVGAESGAGVVKPGSYGLIFDSGAVYSQINSSIASTSISSGWNYVTLTYDRTGGSSQQKLYINGALRATATLATAIATNTNSLFFGDLLNGQIDEVELMNATRTPSWIKTRYNNQRSVNSFLTVSSEERVVSYYQNNLIINIDDSTPGYKWQVMACDEDNDCSGWGKYNLTTPNFKIDTVSPSAPGQLTENSKTSNSVTINFGAATDELNFTEYKIFYASTSPISEANTLYGSTTDINLLSKTYGGASSALLEGLAPDTQYYFNIWAYDVVGHKTSSTMATITTRAAVSSPGVAFYTKYTRVLYYRVWNGTAWSVEQAGPTVGSGATDYIRQIRTVRSDDGGKIAVLIKTWDTANQEWWATVYRFAANDFVNTTPLGAALANANNNLLMTGCLAALSGQEFMIVRTADAADGTLVYSWNQTAGWVAEAAGPNPVAVLNGCELVRRPGTDNYILLTFDDDSDVGTSYYYGGSTYANSWTVWTEHSTQELNADNYVGNAFFDPSDNTRGAINYGNSNVNSYAYAKYFVCTDTTINYGSEYSSPTTAPDNWGGIFVNGEFAPNPAGVGIAYYAGQDSLGQVNVYKLDASQATLSWATTTYGDNISTSSLYGYANRSQKPFALDFYKDNKGVVLWNSSAASSTYYRIIDATSNAVSTSSMMVPGSFNDNWTRVRTYKDPSEDQLLTIYQNNNVDYAAVFFEGGNDRFFTSTTSPGTNQLWTMLATSTNATFVNDERFSYAYTAYNVPPNSPSNLQQLKLDGVTAVANQGWTNQDHTNLRMSATDNDTQERLALYVEVLLNNDVFTSSTSEPTTFCASTTKFANCSPKIWLVASSSLGDYSVTPFTATIRMGTTTDSSIGYKWRGMVCDSSHTCSSWTEFNSLQPNFKVDTASPSAPGALTVLSRTSQSVTLRYGATTTESNFSRYELHYKVGASGVLLSDFSQSDTNLNNILFNGTTTTIVLNLSSSTQYTFNIWAFDLAGNLATATPEVSTTTAALPSLRQTSYAWENDDSADANSNTFATSTYDATTTLVNLVERFNLRIQLENSGGDIASNKVYKLQFENRTDSPNNWVDVGAATSVSYTLGLSSSNGMSVSSRRATPTPATWANGTWHENTNLTNSYSLANGSFTEFVFAVKLNYAAANKVYRLRLFNNTDNKVLDTYVKYPVITTVAAETIRYAKGSYAVLPSAYGELTYPLDPLGYSDVAINEDINRDELSTSQIPIYYFAVKNANNTDAITATWNGQSTVAMNVKSAVLQVYSFGSPNQWQTVRTDSTSGANADFTLTGNFNSALANYYGTSNWSYWRMYQESGTETLSTDYINVAFTTPVPEVRQNHYRWRADDGSETTASWRELQDTGDPVLPIVNLNRGEVVRLRLEAVNLGAGATSSSFQLQYATSSGDCSVLTNWNTVPLDTTKHWTMATSSSITNRETSTAQLSNAEGYTFVSGTALENPYGTSTAISLSEGRYTEVEYVIKPTSNAVDATTYCFRMTNNGIVLNGYDKYPILTMSGNLNNAPAFSVTPSDNGSASTAPTQYGSNVSFSATAGDIDGDEYYLALCKTNSISAGNDGPPSCTAGSWCISSSTASSTQATCTYTATDNNESLSWYAFACDKVAGFGLAKCSAMSQGNGSLVNNSPFAINHPPLFTGVQTLSDNLPPGSSFTIWATSSDTDVAGGNDSLTLYVCNTNAATWSGCTNVTLCSAASSSNPYCSINTTAPVAAATINYYAFVYDNHTLGSLSNSRASSYTITNSAPTFGALLLNNGSDITLGVRGAGDTSVSTVNTSVEDLNGCSTLVSATAAIYMSNATNGYNCTADNNDCYRIGVSNCVISNCSGGVDMLATLTCTASIKYYAISTDGYSGNPNASYNWKSYLNVYDGSNYAATTSAGIEMISSLAIDVQENLIDFGQNMKVGENTGPRNATTSIINAGNCPLDSNLSGNNMSGNPSGTISVNQIKWNLAQTFNYPVAGTVLTNGGVLADLNAPRPTSTVDVVDKVYWGIGIPYGTDRSLYTGKNFFAAILDNDGW